MRVLIVKNGIARYRDATPEETAELERLAAEMPEPVPTPEERLTELEEALALLLSGKTEVDG